MARFQSSRRSLAVGLAYAVLLLAACSSAAAPQEQTPNAVFGEAEAAPAERGPVPAGAGEAGGTTTDQAAGAGSTANEGSAMPADQALIVKTGTLQLEVGDVAATLVKARSLVAALGGYVSGSDEANQGENRTASITYRIPAARWEDALDGLRGLATKVVSEQTGAVEVTGQVVDLGARIDNLRASETALQGIMERATKISDILEVQSQLTDVRGEIEQLTAEKQHLQDQAAYGTLTVTYSIPVVAVTVAKQGWDPAAVLDRAVAQLLEIAQGVASTGIWLGVVVLPIVLVLLAVLVPVAFILRRVLRRAGRPPTPMWGPGAGGPGDSAGPGPGGQDQPALPAA